MIAAQKMVCVKPRCETTRRTSQESAPRMPAMIAPTTIAASAKGIPIGPRAYVVFASRFQPRQTSPCKGNCLRVNVRQHRAECGDRHADDDRADTAVRQIEQGGRGDRGAADRVMPTAHQRRLRRTNGGTTSTATIPSAVRPAMPQPIVHHFGRKRKTSV